MSICPSCRKPVDSRLGRCPWDGTLLGAVPVDPLLGTALGGRYLLRKGIAERERRRLYRAEDNTTGRAVLATVVTPAPENDGAAAARFRARAELARTLDHPSCTVVRDFGLLSGGRAYVIEEGEVWHQLEQELVLKGGRLPPSKAVDLGTQLLEALDHLHGKGLYSTGITSSSLRLIFDAQGALKLQVPTAEVIGHALEDTRSDGIEPSQGLAEDLAAAAQVISEMLTGAPRDSAPGGGLNWRSLGLEEEAGRKLQAIVERALGTSGHCFGSAWEMRRELESILGRSRLGRYTMLHRIAVGGMGEIYLARPEGIEGLDINRLCVIKTIRTALMQSPEFVERFLAEARVLASLSHGNIVPVHDVGKVGSVFYIAMEYVAGKDLRKILSRAAKENKRMSVPLALFIAKELANGLAYAHRAKVQGIGGLVHRDVSPHNTLVSYEGEVRLIDFGLAKAAAELNSCPDEVVMGKVCYISPEQARAEPLDQRTDIYSAGLVLFELLTGEPFFNQPTTEEVLQHVGDPTVEPPSARVPGIPVEVDRICLRAMAPERDQRYRSAAALRDDLTAELARLAPRTNPEEVGAFVRALFAAERREEETLISDLSLTIPPRGASPDADPEALAAASATTEPRPVAETSSAALSLLGRNPLPIQLASTLHVPPGQPSTESPARPPATVSWGADSGGESQTETETQRTPPPLLLTKPRRSDPTLGTAQLPQLDPRPAWRSPLVLALLIGLVGGGGLIGGFWLSSSRTRAAREAERATLKALQGWSRGMGKGDARGGPNAGIGPASPSANRRGDVVADSSERPQRSRVRAKAPSRGPEPCLLVVRGGDGLELILDGKVAPRRLPLTHPLPIGPGSHTLVVRGAGLEPYRQTLQCASGDLLTVRLRLGAP